MCFFEQQVYTCGDFKWSQFREQCPFQQGIENICHIKLVMKAIYVDEKCDICLDIEKKENRFRLEEDRIMQ